MTEESYQGIGKLMRKARYWRSQMIYTKSEMDKWEELLNRYIIEKRVLSAESAKINIEKYRIRHKQASEIFSSLQITEPLCQE